MPINQTIHVKQSVGKNGVNQGPDVRAVQTQINAQIPASLTKLAVNGICCSKTIDAIIDFQKVVLRFSHPDGRVDPNGKTLRALNDLASEAKWAGRSHHSSTGQWSGDSARWPQEKKLQSLNPAFRIKVVGVIDALKSRGFQPKIFYGWRSVAVQEELFRKNRSKVRFSFHNAQKPDGTPNSYAADIIDQRWGWQKPAQDHGFWDVLGEEAKKRSLVWGGDWKNFKDVAHIQGRLNSELAQVKRESNL